MADSWKIFFDDEKIESHFSIDRGISLMTDGGCFEVTWIYLVSSMGFL